MQADLVKKLMIKKPMRMLVLHEPEGYLDDLSALPEGSEVSQEPEEGAFDFVQLFAKSVADLNEHAETAIRSVKEDGLLWICYPKKSGKIKTDITRDNGWKRVIELGYDGVSQVSIDETWSALRFRSAELVGRRDRKEVDPDAAAGVKPEPRPRVAPEDRVVVTPDDLAALFVQHPEAGVFYEGLAYSHKKEYVNWITSAKREETRANRLAKTIEKLESGIKNPHLKG